ncbi:hypothetical protein AJ80_06175 [Polytolypa hystricis UAMH7299]|uniref:DWNN domain-containing protein n=1 Tax=Polytolypa hystricis (strain UAMH7299) TaxID=1447883 RepID=A0A2B7XZ89_POLH7|nr:hypothetical protein AJ80_06175 [Polytolypa hystricis UAMH7299]
MTSSVHFKFKSQKEPSRVTFDGTGISVFELKKEIINQNRLGDGSDFELAIYNEGTNEEYDDDTTIIPRSTSIIARRLPAARPGKGGAARYVSGKMPVTTRTTSRADPPGLKSLSNSEDIAGGISGLSGAQSEDEKIKALFSLQESQWKEQQEGMANATPVPFGRGRGKPVTVPDHPPPPGYLCYRCREKGHWIQACPTNNDPKFDARYRVKRSTGIPRSLQVQVDKPDPLAMDGSTEGSKISGVMVNADGDFVIAQPDKASWELYQEKAKAAAAAAAESAAAESTKELQSRGLLCPVDRRMFIEPTKTPCCGKTYCNDCITNALIESDFVCPNCSTAGVLLDNLRADDDAAAQTKDFEIEKTRENLNNGGQGSSDEKESMSVLPTISEANTQHPNTTDKPSPLVKSSAEPTLSLPRKRSLGDASIEGTVNGSVAPSMKKQKSQENESKITTADNSIANSVRTFVHPPRQQPFVNTPQPSYNHFVGNGVHPNPGYAAGMNAPMLQTPLPYSHPGDGWNQMGGINLNSHGGPYFNHFNDPMMGPGGYGPPNPMGGHGLGGVGFAMGFNEPPANVIQHQQFQQNPGMRPFSNQQRTTFGGPFSKEEDNAYLRQPVNPYRHQARQKRTRPSDYREL